MDNSELGVGGPPLFFTVRIATTEGAPSFERCLLEGWDRDSYHAYTYDAEGNITAVGSGATAQYVYDALNHRVRTTVNGTAKEFVFNANGQRVSIWDGTSHVQLAGQYYWGSKPVAYYANSAAHFQHQDWLGTERLRTTYNGGVEGTYTSLPFGDAQAASGTDGDSYHYAMLDSDTESGTDHAQYRQYSSTQGRWLSPDPYSGSYDFSDPQSLNRYAYVVNNPVAALDPSGLVRLPYAVGYDGGSGCYYVDWSDDETGDFDIEVDCGSDVSLPPPPPAGWMISDVGGGGGGGGGGSAPNNTSKTTNKNPNYAQCVAQARSNAEGNSAELEIFGGIGLGNAVVGCAFTGPFIFECEGGVAALELLYTGVNFAAEQYSIHQGIAACGHP